MKTCRDCEKEISRSAKDCPHCGAKKPNQGKVEHSIESFLGGVSKFCFSLVIGLFGLAFLLFLIQVLLNSFASVIGVPSE